MERKASGPGMQGERVGRRRRTLPSGKFQALEFARFLIDEVYTPFDLLVKYPYCAGNSCYFLSALEFMAVANMSISGAI